MAGTSLLLLARLLRRLALPGAWFLCLFLASGCSDHPPSASPQKVTIAIASLPETALAYVADAQGFFRDCGLEAKAHYFPYGKIALQEVLDGKADFATVAETPVMFAIMNGAEISVVATIFSSTSGHMLVARRDRGIGTIADLRGKRIATTSGTSAQFFLDTMLATNGIAGNDVAIVDLPAGKMADALARGEVDAISGFGQYSLLARRKLGAGAVVFSDPDVYRYIFNVVATREFVRKNPEKVRRMLRALLEADDFVHRQPVAARNVASRVTGIDTDTVRDIWEGFAFGLALDQTLILALEDESEWAIKHRLTTATKVPNYLQYIYLDGLLAVNPKAVRILK